MSLKRKELEDKEESTRPTKKARLEGETEKSHVTLEDENSKEQEALSFLRKILAETKTERYVNLICSDGTVKIPATHFHNISDNCNLIYKIVQDTKADISYEIDCTKSIAGYLATYLSKYTEKYGFDDTFSKASKETLLIILGVSQKLGIKVLTDRMFNLLYEHAKHLELNLAKLKALKEKYPQYKYDRLYKLAIMRAKTAYTQKNADFVKGSNVCLCSKSCSGGKSECASYKKSISDFNFNSLYQEIQLDIFKSDHYKLC